MRLGASATKNRRGAVQPLPMALVDHLRAWLRSKPPGRPLFSHPRSTAHMVAMDLKAAGLPVVDGEGRVDDLHAFRGTYVTGLILGGASVKATAVLARHSDPRLRLGVYASLDLAERSSAVQDLSAYFPCAATEKALKERDDRSAETNIYQAESVRRKLLEDRQVEWRERMGIGPTRSRSHDPSPVLKTGPGTSHGHAPRGGFHSDRC